MIALIALVCQALSAADTACRKPSERWCPLDSYGNRRGGVAPGDIPAGDHTNDRLDRLACSKSRRLKLAAGFRLLQAA
jgi:hypothetical protein